MARKPRIHLDGAFYHVMLRGNAGEDIFFDRDDRHEFYALLGEIVERYNCRIHAFCLMTNHVHIAFQVGAIPLSKIIQNISFRYTRLINKKRNKIGHLFQGRYKAIMVDADNYLLTLIKYIHLNPVRAKIVNNAEDYLWSSHRSYLYASSFEWLTTQHVYKFFSIDDAIAKKSYIKFMNEVKLDNTELDFEKPNQKSFPVICDDAFMKKLEILQNSQINNSDFTLNQIIIYVCKFYQIDESQLHKNSRDRLSAKIRAIIAWLAIEFKISNITQVGNYFGREHSTVSKSLTKIISSSDQNILILIKKFIINAHMQA